MDAVAGEISPRAQIRSYYHLLHVYPEFLESNDLDELLSFLGEIGRSSVDTMILHSKILSHSTTADLCHVLSGGSSEKMPSKQARARIPSQRDYDKIRCQIYRKIVELLEKKNSIGSKEREIIHILLLTDATQINGDFKERAYKLLPSFEEYTGLDALVVLTSLGLSMSTQDFVKHVQYFVSKLPQCRESAAVLMSQYIQTSSKQQQRKLLDKFLQTHLKTACRADEANL